MKRLIAGACAIILLGGCQRDPAAEPASGAGQHTHAAPVDKAQRLAQYREAVLSLLPGAYDGGCFGNDPQHPGEVAIDSAGRISKPGWQADLMRGTAGLVLSRTIPNERAEWRVEVSGKADPGAGVNAGAKALPSLPPEGPDGFRCAFAAVGEQHQRKRLYAAVAPFFIQARTTLGCSEGGITQSWRIEPGNDAVQVGQRQLSLVHGVETEYIHFDTRAGTLGYSVFYLDGTMFGMNIDSTGRFVDVLTGGGQSSFGCRPAALR